MIRLAHISDSHFDERGRLDDVVDVHRAFLLQAAAAGVDLIVHAGDWFERRSTPAERLAVADFLEAASRVAPVFGVKGNHDAELDLTLFPRLDGDRGLWILDRPTAAPGSAIIVDEPNSAPMGLLALPWFDKAHLVAGLGAHVDAEDTRLRTIAAAQDLLTALRAEATRLKAEGVIPILVTHILLGGSVVSTGQVLIGTTVELSPSDLLDVGAAYVACGHVHKTQEWFGGRVAYSGSPHRCNFGEPEAKGWRLVTLTDAGEFVSNEFMRLPAREMVLVEVDFTKTFEDGYYITEHLRPLQKVDGALVRFRYRIKAEDLATFDAEQARLDILKAGAAEVQVEAIVEAESRAREGSDAIALVQTTAEKLDLYLKAKGIALDDAARGRVHAKLAELEAAS